MKKVLVDPKHTFFTLLTKLSQNNETQRETHSVAISKIAQV